MDGDVEGQGLVGADRGQLTATQLALAPFTTVVAATVAGAGIAEVLVVAVVPESEVVLAGLELCCI